MGMMKGALPAIISVYYANHEKCTLMRKTKWKKMKWKWTKESHRIINGINKGTKAERHEKRRNEKR